VAVPYLAGRCEVVISLAISVTAGLPGSTRQSGGSPADVDRGAPAEGGVGRLRRGPCPQAAVAFQRLFRVAVVVPAALSSSFCTGDVQARRSPLCCRLAAGDLLQPNKQH